MNPRLKRTDVNWKYVLIAFIAAVLMGIGIVLYIDYSVKILGPFEIEIEPKVEEKIISSEVTVDKCRLKVVTTKREIFLETNIGIDLPEIRCYQFLLNKVSSSGEYMAFQDLSGGVDSMIQVFSIKHQDTVLLDVYGTSDIFDIIFLPDDRLAILHGYRGLYDEQYLKIYDIAGLFANYPDNIDQRYNYFTNIAEYSKSFVLPDVGKNYFSLYLGEEYLEIHGTPGSEDVLFKFDITDSDLKWQDHE